MPTTSSKIAAADATQPLAVIPTAIETVTTPVETPNEEVIVWPDVKSLCETAKAELSTLSTALRYHAIVDTIVYLRRRYTADMKYDDRGETQRARLAYAFELDRELMALDAPRS